MSIPPSDILKNASDELGGKTPFDDDITKIALLPTHEVHMVLPECVWQHHASGPSLLPAHEVHMVGLFKTGI